MRLVVNIDHPFEVETKQGTMSINRLVRLLRFRSGRSITELTRLIGIEHPRLWLLEKEQSHSIDTFLRAVDALGYEVIIRKRNQG